MLCGSVEFLYEKFSLRWITLVYLTFVVFATIMFFSYHTYSKVTDIQTQNVSFQEKDSISDKQKFEQHVMTRNKFLFQIKLNS